MFFLSLLIYLLLPVRQGGFFLIKYDGAGNPLQDLTHVRHVLSHLNHMPGTHVS